VQLQLSASRQELEAPTVLFNARALWDFSFEPTGDKEVDRCIALATIDRIYH